MDIRQIQYFVQICLDGSFSKASQNIYVTQQALSKAISNLESYFGQPLFYRTKKGVTLTEFGEFLWCKSEKLLSAYENLNNEITQFKMSSKGIIRLGVSVGMISYITPNMIMDFRNMNPFIQLSMQEISTLDCEREILAENLDMAIALRPMDKDMDKFDVTLLKTHSMIAVINKNNPLSKKPFITVKDLEGQNLLPNRGRNRYNLELLCRENGFEPNIVGSSYQMIDLLSLVDKNDYIAFCVDFNAREHANLPNVRLVPFQGNTYLWEMCLITQKGRNINNATVALREYIINSLSKDK
jgi:DNA-binding transcriptional LysR family regulator